MKEIKDLGFGIIQVDELKPTISKMESVDKYLCKWQKLKEWLNEKMQKDRKYQKMGDLRFKYYAQTKLTILNKMQELEGEDVKD